MISEAVAWGGSAGLRISDRPEPAGTGVETDGGLLRAVDGADAALVSFDIFDTVLTRTVGEPSALFYEIGAEVVRRGLVDSSALMFVQVRYATEQRARTNKDGREVSLREIYDEVVQVLNCEHLIEELMEIELEAESQSLRPIPQAKRAVDLARERCGRVIFISDMYLPHAFIQARLVEAGFFLPSDHLYLSSDVGVQKGDGRLFQHVLKSEGIKAKDLFHCGDSLRYDIEPAKKLGIRCFHTRLAIPHPSEAALNRRSSWNGGFGAALAGAARLARLGCKETDPVKRTMWETGATVTGPFVLLYAQWILDRSLKMGVTQLCFLARDGYFPYLAVKELLSKSPGTPVTARYIHGSRPTYLALGVESMGAEEWERLTVHGGMACRTIADIAAALMSGPETVAMLLGKMGLLEEDKTRDLQPPMIEAIRSLVLEDPALNAAVVRDLKNFQNRFRRYLADQGFDPAEGTALIDSGWTTRSHAPLYHFLRGMGCGNLKLFYIGVMVDETHIPISSVEAFVFDMARRRGPISRKIYYARPCEALLFADHGRTVDFGERNGSMQPVFDLPENPEAIERYFKSYRGGITAFLRKAITDVGNRPPPFGVADLAQQVISRFWCEPTVEEAGAWARMDWQWDPQGRVTYPFSRKYRLGDIWHAIRQERCPQCYPQFWVAGSSVISNPKIVFILRSAGKMSRVVRDALRHLPVPVRQLAKRMMRSVRRGRESTTLSASAMMALELAPYLAK